MIITVLHDFHCIDEIKIFQDTFRIFTKQNRWSSTRYISFRLNIIHISYLLCQIRILSFCSLHPSKTTCMVDNYLLSACNIGRTGVVFHAAGAMFQIYLHFNINFL